MIQTENHQKRVIEKMLGRELNDKEIIKIDKVSYNESLIWTKNQCYKEGKKLKVT